MSTQTLIGADYAQLYFHEHSGIVHHRVTPKMTGKQWRALLSTGTEVLKKNRATKWLADNRSMATIPEEDCEWINNYWLPDTLAQGWRYWAVVVPDGWLARNNMVEFVTQFRHKGIRILVFTEVDMAMDWLASVGSSHSLSTSSPRSGLPAQLAP